MRGEERSEQEKRKEACSETTIRTRKQELYPIFVKSKKVKICDQEKQEEEVKEDSTIPRSEENPSESTVREEPEEDKKEEEEPSSKTEEDQ